LNLEVTLSTIGAVMRNRLAVSAILIAAALLAPHSAATQTFQPGDVYLIDGSSALYNISGGGDFSAAVPLATFLSTTGVLWGEMCFSTDRTMMYVPAFNAGTVYTVTASGMVTSFATGLITPLEVECLPDGTILVQEYDNGRVVDITGGGDFTAASGFITHPDFMRGLTLASNGDLLVGAYDDGEVRVGTAGGPFSALPLVGTIPGAAIPLQSVNEGFGGAILVGTGGDGGDIYDLQTGSPVLFAYGREFLNTATSTVAGAVYATDTTTDQVFDITAGGDFSAASPFAYGFVSIDSGIAVVPSPVGTIFSDGFETGDTTEWSDAVP
jgi:hypothetical protein